MKRILFTFLPLFIFSTMIGAQTKDNNAISNQIKSLKAEKILVLNYDGSSNYTKILAYGEDFGREQDKRNNLSGFSFGMTFSYSGRELTAAPQSFITTFWATGKKSGFAASHALTITIDGENLELGDARYATKSGDNREFLNFNFPRDYLVKIVNGKNVQMKIGNATFNFTPEHLKLFAGLLAISNLN